MNARVFRPSREAVFFVCAFAAAVGLASLRMAELSSADTFMHVRVGSGLLEAGSLAVPDSLSYTRPGARYVYHEWLAQLVFALAHRALGLDGLVLCVALAAGLVAALLARTAARLGARASSTAVTLALVWGLMHYFLVARPQLATYVGFAAGLGALARERKAVPGPFALAAVFAGFSLWTCLHPGSFVFLGMLAIEVALARDARARRGLALVLAAAALGTIATPYGLQAPRKVLAFMTEPYFHEAIQEHREFDLGAPIGRIFSGLAAAFVFCAAVGWRRLRLATVVQAAALAALTLYARRNLPLFLIAACPVFALGLDAVVDALIARAAGLRPAAVSKARWAAADLRRGLSARDLAVPLAGVAACLGFLLARAAPLTRPPREAEPFDLQPAVDFARAHPGQLAGRMYSDYTTNSFLLFALPEQAVFVDSRADLYGPELLAQSARITAGQSGAVAALDRWGVGWALLRPRDGLAAVLEAHAWREAYRDQAAVIFARPQ